FVAQFAVTGPHPLPPLSPADHVQPAPGSAGEPGHAFSATTLSVGVAPPPQWPLYAQFGAVYVQFGPPVVVLSDAFGYPVHAAELVVLLHAPACSEHPPPLHTHLSVVWHFVLPS